MNSVQTPPGTFSMGPNAGAAPAMKKSERFGSDSRGGWARIRTPATGPAHGRCADPTGALLAVGYRAAAVSPRLEPGNGSALETKNRSALAPIHVVAGPGFERQRLAPPTVAAQAPQGPCSLWATGPPLFLPGSNPETAPPLKRKIGAPWLRFTWWLGPDSNASDWPRPRSLRRPHRGLARCGLPGRRCFSPARTRKRLRP
jgi:hypothetical protein